MTRLKVIFAALLPAFTVTLSASAQFAPPIPAELAMTSAPEAPGAPAIILFKEQIQDDKLHMQSYYFRIKVLTEGGKEQANVELPYLVDEAGVNIDSIAGRTIHPDGTIVPFTGKPYDKLIEKGTDYRVKSKVFTLPQVEVGSVLEYRYKFRFDDYYFIRPDWYVQSDLFTRKAHFSWKATGEELTEKDGGVVHVAWTPILPPGAKVVDKALPVDSAISGGRENVDLIELDLNNVPQSPHEAMMPPLDSLSYRVLFYYTSVRTAGEYWDKNGKTWSKARDKFIGPNDRVRAQANSLVSPADTPDVKVKKLYDYVMTLENTDFTRKHSQDEDKSLGFHKITSTDDILDRKRGSSDDLTQLFVSLVRALNMKAYLMAVSDRSEHLFMAQYLSMRQLDDLIAIVTLDGKDTFFDPGQRYMPFKHLAWTHTLTSGIRQMDGGKTAIVNTPQEPYMFSHTKRIADLEIAENGIADGTVTLEYTGAPALRWRHLALRGDDTNLNQQLRESLEHDLPGGVDVRVLDVANLSDGEKPLTVKYAIKGAIGTSTSKRLLLPESLFESNHKPEFPQEKRELAIDMRYAESVQDAVRYKYPASFAVESVPTDAITKLNTIGQFSTASKQSPNAITLFRNYTVAVVYFGPEEYPELRGFYNKLESKQAESLVLTREKPAATPTATPAGN